MPPKKQVRTSAGPGLSLSLFLSLSETLPHLVNGFVHSRLVRGRRGALIFSLTTWSAHKAVSLKSPRRLGGLLCSYFAHVPLSIALFSRVDNRQFRKLFSYYRLARLVLAIVFNCLIVNSADPRFVCCDPVRRWEYTNTTSHTAYPCSLVGSSIVLLSI